MTAFAPRNHNPRRPRRHQRSRPSQKLPPQHKWLVGEIIFKLGLNGILLLMAGIAISRLIPYHQTQQAKLEEIEMQVAETDKRVQFLRQEFNRSFDPGQSRLLMEELSPRQNPHQRRIILTPSEK